VIVRSVRERKEKEVLVKTHPQDQDQEIEEIKELRRKQFGSLVFLG
jgi:hypothetical protein